MQSTLALWVNAHTFSVLAMSDAKSLGSHHACSEQTLLLRCAYWIHCTAGCAPSSRRGITVSPKYIFHSVVYPHLPRCSHAPACLTFDRLCAKLHMLELPADPVQIPDIFVYLVSEASRASTKFRQGYRSFWVKERAQFRLSQI